MGERDLSGGKTDEPGLVVAPPSGWSQLVGRLAASRGLIGLIRAADDHLVGMVGELVQERISVGQEILSLTSSTGVGDAVKPTKQSVLVSEFEVWFSHHVDLDPMALLRRLSAGRALFAAWPGSIGGGRASFSRPGRADYFDQPLRNLVTLLPTYSVFPDETPYELEFFPE